MFIKYYYENNHFSGCRSCYFNFIALLSCRKSFASFLHSLFNGQMYLVIAVRQASRSVASSFRICSLRTQI